jgi:hypothetical protein
MGRSAASADGDAPPCSGLSLVKTRDSENRRTGRADGGDDLPFSRAVRNSEFVKKQGHLFLLVALEKGDLAESFQYKDRFLGPDLFQWESQNRTRRDSVAGQALSRHQEEGYQVHLFVRRTKTIKGRAAPFVYCGEVGFEGWENDAPITVRWRLPEPVPPALREVLRVPPEP